MLHRQNVLLEELRVEGGFLDGLEMQFLEGLNVLIGARGTGKTSVIELIRLCTSAPSFAERFERRAQDHALSILGDGKVTLRMSAGGEAFELTRTARDSAVPPIPRGPLVVSQNEIEVVGLDARGRLRLVDEFRDPATDLVARGRAVSSAIGSVSERIVEVEAELSILEERVAAIPELANLLASATDEADAGALSMAEAGPQLARLNALSTSSAQRAAAIDVLARAEREIASWSGELQRALSRRPRFETWPLETPSPLDRVDDGIQKFAGEMQAFVAKLEALEEPVQEASTREQSILAQLDDEARALRAEIETIQVGAGAAARKVAEYREQLARLEQFQALHSRKTEQRADLIAKRRQLLTDQQALREERLAVRETIVSDLNEALTPRIRVRLKRLGALDAYSAAIGDSLAGSGLRYAQMSASLAQTLAPSELARAIEDNDVAGLAIAAGVNDDRAARAVSHLRSEGIGQILTAPIEDEVGLELLDGRGYKESSEVSTGQRCTIVLPIVLHHDDRTVVLDQPEDHLDTAFIVDTFVQAIRARRVGSQLIMSTHNANVPVLGDADRVFVLESDGGRGFVRCEGGLESAEIVDWIERLMEGGRDAFARRARFYGNHDDV